MPLSVSCPHCGKGFSLASELRGKKVRCKACQETFVVKDSSASDEDADEDESPARKSNDRLQTSPRSTKKSAPVREREEDEEEDRPRRKDKKRPAKKESSGVPVLLIVGGIVALLVVVGGVGGAIWMFSSKRAAPAPVAQAGGPPPAPVQPVANPAPQPPAQPAQPATPPVNPAPKPPPPKKVEDGFEGPPAPEGWYWYIQPSKAYALWLPKTGRKLFQREETTRIQGENIRYTVLQCEIKDNIKVHVLVLRVPVKKGEQLDKTTVIEVFRDLYLKEAGGTITGTSDFMVGQFQGKEYQVDLKTGEKTRLRLFMPNLAIYQIWVTGTKEQVDGEAARRVFESFKNEGLVKAMYKKEPPDKKP